MKTRSNLFVIILTCLSFNLGAQARMIPMQADQWEFIDTNVLFKSHNGTAALEIIGFTDVVLKDFTFKTGTIEFDFFPTELGFCGLKFRRSSQPETPFQTDYSEYVYLRNFDPEGKTMQGGIQYAPFLRGTNMWDMLFQYEAPIAIIQNGKNHLKLEISEYQMKVFLNGKMVLWIPELLGKMQDGGLALAGKGIFANLKVSRNTPESLPNSVGADLTDHDMRILRNWEYSSISELKESETLTALDVPDSNTVWKPIQVERFGTINLTRHLSSPFKEQTRKVVWLRTLIESEVNEYRKLDLGFSDDIWVFNQGYLVYLDKNKYGYPIQKKPNGRLSLENATIDLPLVKGTNHVMIAVASDFFGWGLVARFHQIDGLIF